MFSNRKMGYLDALVPISRMRGIWSKRGLGRAFVDRRGNTSSQIGEYKKRSSLAHEGDRWSLDQVNCYP